MNRSLLSDPPVPVGIPAVFLDDALTHGVSAHDLLDASASTLLHQYRAAKGFEFEWGHVVEDSMASNRQRLLTSWRFVPVTVYHAFVPARTPRVPAIPLLLRGVRVDLPRLLRPQLASGVIVTGCHPQSFLHPHALLCLQIVDAKLESKVRRWLDDMFIPEILPTLIELVHARILTRRMQPPAHPSFMPSIAH